MNLEQTARYLALIANENPDAIVDYDGDDQPRFVWQFYIIHARQFLKL